MHDDRWWRIDSLHGTMLPCSSTTVARRKSDKNQPNLEVKLVGAQCRAVDIRVVAVDIVDDVDLPA